MEYITVCIITYNSSKYITEALESVREQTYPYVDLIVSDDKSSDNTVEICKKWMDEHKDRFRKCELVLTEVNTGAAGNLNRGIARCETEWIKCMAGDDALYPDFLQKFIEQYSDSKYDILCTYTGVYMKKLDEDGFRYYYITNPIFFMQTSQKQHAILLRRNLLGPCTITRKRIIDAIGGYNENYPLIEDWPFYLEITRLGYPVGEAKLLATKYRISDDSVQTGTSSRRFELDRNRFYKDLVLQEISGIGKWIIKKRVELTESFYSPSNSVSEKKYRRKLGFLNKLRSIVDRRYIIKGGMKRVLSIGNTI